jgi:uncharacterized protein YndB with AHSA1/START domain
MTNEAKRQAYRPGEPGDATVEKNGAHFTLVFVRELRHPPDKVWRALTEPSELREWAPFDADRDLGAMGNATLRMAGADDDGEPVVSKCRVSKAERPNLLEYTWDEDVLRWELVETPAGTRLTLRHTLSDKTWLPKVAAGWHICLDVVERALVGEPIGRIVAKRALEFDWERLNDQYTTRFAVANTGVPENISAR